MFYHYLADFIATVHTAYVAFVVFGLLAVYLGKWAGWQWVHNRWFRGIHLVMILGVIARTCFADVCPLSTWEGALRELGNARGASGTAFGKWMHDIIHPEEWMETEIDIKIFAPIYAVFGALVVGTLWLVPVHWRGRPTEKAEPAVA